jgi:5-formyltetrahydrofolate cyclo-ligase
LQDPQQIRREIRARRRALSVREQKGNSLRMTRTLTRSKLFRNSQRIAIYVENDGEMGVSNLLSTIISLGKRCYLPALRPMRPNRLWFMEYRPEDHLTPNRYGIIEPSIHRRKPRPAYSLDLVLVPLVAFDATGNRIGMGGGFYDRTFSYLTFRNKWHKPRLVGVAHELQRLNSIKKNPWDISLDAVVTERCLYSANKTGTPL